MIDSTCEDCEIDNFFGQIWFFNYQWKLRNFDDFFEAILLHSVKNGSHIWIRHALKYHTLCLRENRRPWMCPVHTPLNSKLKQAIDQLWKRGEGANFCVHFEPQTCHVWCKNEWEIVKNPSQTDLKVDKTIWYKPSVKVLSSRIVKCARQWRQWLKCVLKSIKW